MGFVAPEPGEGLTYPRAGEPLTLLEEPVVGGAPFRALSPLLEPAFAVDRLAWPGTPLVVPEGGVSVAEAWAAGVEGTDRFPVHLLAGYLSAMPAIQLALTRPDLVRSLILLQPVVRWLEEASIPDDDPSDLFRDVARAAERGDIAGTRRAWLQAFSLEPDSPEGRSILEAPALPARPHALRDALDRPPVDTRALAEVLHPVLVLSTELAPAPLRRGAEWLTSHLPNVQRLELPGAGPLVPWSEPARVTGVLFTFCLERNVPVS